MESDVEPNASGNEASVPKRADEEPPPIVLERDPLLAKTVWLTGGVGGLLTVVAGIVMGPFWAIGTLVGGALATANLALFIKLGRGLLAQGTKSASRALILLGLLKLLGLFACVFVLVRQGAVSPLAFAIGYGALPISISLSPLIKPAPGKARGA